MSPNPWELTAHIRYRTDEMRTAREAEALRAALRSKPGRWVALKRGVGIALIHLGEQLAGRDRIDGTRHTPGWGASGQVGGW